MVGIFALLNGEARSGFSMRCCDLRHNHSCQLAHYGFCPKPLSDMRRALYSPGSSHEGIVFVSSPEQDWEENIQLTLARVRASDWQTLSFLLLKPSPIEDQKFQAHSHNGGSWKFKPHPFRINVAIWPPPAFFIEVCKTSQLLVCIRLSAALKKKKKKKSIMKSRL